MTEDERNAGIFRALGSPGRAAMIRLLKARPLCVKMLAKKLRMTEPAASQHLNVLKSLGVVKGEKTGLFVHYSVDKNVLDKWKKYADKFFEIQD